MSQQAFQAHKELLVSNLQACLKIGQKRGAAMVDRLAFLATNARPGSNDLKIVDETQVKLARLDGLMEELSSIVSRFDAEEGGNCSHFSFLCVARDNVALVSYPQRDCDAWDFTARKMGKPGKVFAQYLKEHCSKGAIDLLGELYGEALALAKEDYTYRIVRGNDVLTGYTVVSSCMAKKTDMRGSSALGLYAHNTDKVGLMIVSKNDINNPEDLARCLVWTVDSGETYVDRVYPNTSNAIPYIARVASRNGWMMREDHCMSGNGKWINGGVYYVTMKDVDAYPYMDTFCWTKGPEEGEFVLTNSECQYELNSTGNVCPWTSSCCSSCGTHVEDEAVQTFGDSQYCESCFSDVAFTCDECGGVESQQNRYSACDCELCEDCFHASYFSCDRCGEGARSDDSVVVICRHGDESWCSWCAERRTFECGNCAHVYSSEGIAVLVMNDEQLWCNGCVEENSMHCEECGTLYSMDFGCTASDCTASEEG